jgi:hypothetical protein
MADGRVRIVVRESIVIDASQPRVSADHPAMLRLARELEEAVIAWPDQWLVLQKAWCEDML